MQEEILVYVKRFLEAHDSEESGSRAFPFRKRSDHLRRVCAWAERLMKDSRLPKIDHQAVTTAALFHDVGYALSKDGKDHAEKGVEIFSRYALDRSYDPQRTGWIAFLIRNHSDKALIQCDDTPLELVILMEADLLDEAGAMSIVWDCMVEGAQPEQSFAKTYRHIIKYSGKILGSSPMRTERAKEIWLEKQRLTGEFIRQFSEDLCGMP